MSMFKFMFAPTKVKTARSYFQRRTKFLREYTEGNSKVDEKIIAAEVAANTSAILSTLDPLSPIDDYFISDEKKVIIGKFLSVLNNTILTEVHNTLQKGKTVGFVKPTKVYKRIFDDNWNTRNRTLILTYYDKYFGTKPDDSNETLLEQYEVYKGDTKLNSPIVYSACAFITVDELKLRLWHVLSLTREKKVDWNRLYLLLTVQERFSDYYDNFINTIETRASKKL